MMSGWMVVLLIVIFAVSMIIAFALGAASTINAVNKSDQRRKERESATFTNHIFDKTED